jgi:4-amino-4-deoxy-L-arabinose transferase-like glycosyltransferase
MSPNGTGRRERVLLAAILLVALAARVAVAVATRSWIFPTQRAFGFEMGDIASSIAAGHGFSWSGDERLPTAWMPPAYPYLIAGVFRLFGTYTPASALVLESVQTALSVATCALIAVVGRRVVGTPAALAAAALLALYPPAIHFAVQKVWSTTLVAFALALLLWLFLRLRERPTAGRALVLGLAFGAGALLEPLTLGILPFGFAWLAVAGGADARLVVRSLGLVLATVLVITAPWLARNRVVFDSFVFIRSNFGHELYLGNNELATGRWNDEIPDQILPGGVGSRGCGEGGGPPGSGTAPAAASSLLLTPREAAFVCEADEPEMNRFFLRKAVAWIRSHPARFAELTALRVADYWTNVRRTDTPEAKLAAASYAGLMALALAGVAAGVLRRPGAVLVLLFGLALSLPFYVTIVRHWRYRFPVEALVTLFAGYALASLLGRVRRGRPSRGAAAGPPLQPVGGAGRAS